MMSKKKAVSLQEIIQSLHKDTSISRIVVHANVKQEVVVADGASNNEENKEPDAKYNHAFSKMIHASVKREEVVVEEASNNEENEEPDLKSNHAFFKMISSLPPFHTPIKKAQGGFKYLYEATSPDKINGANYFNV